MFIFYIVNYLLTDKLKLCMFVLTFRWKVSEGKGGIWSSLRGAWSLHLFTTDQS